MDSVLDQLRRMTVVVADTGDLQAVKRFQPVDCTTNPSLILKALSDPASRDLIAREMGAGAGQDAAALAGRLTVALGAELTKLVPGRVSTEVEAALSYDTDASVARALDLIADYATRGVSRERVLIKLAATWEGIRAAEILQSEGVDCNLTLVFSMAQAVASAQANAFLISPFVGRISDWYKAAEKRESFAPDEDPGVQSVRNIYAYYKSQGIPTVVMGASFRSIAQIKALAGCDNLTIAPDMLDQLGADFETLERVLDPNDVTEQAPIHMDRVVFERQIVEDPMASELLADGIARFEKDHQTLVAKLEALSST